MCGHFETDSELDNYQSAYKKFNSTTTALLNITDDVYKAMDKSEVTFLILLDYSKAFDVANHRLILAKLKALGFHNDALFWLESYLYNRKQKVKNNLGESEWINLKNGVPQGSILGPLLFLVLVSDLHDVIKYGSYHMYADDTQLYYHCKISDAMSTITKINHDLNSISLYSKNNCLNLNTGKSNFIILGSIGNLSKIKQMSLPPIVLNNDVIERKKTVKNLGVIFDETLSWSTHVNKMISKAYYKLRKIYRFKKFLTRESKITICESYVSSHLNYCDAVYINISEFLQNKNTKSTKLNSQVYFWFEKV